MCVVALYFCSTCHHVCSLPSQMQQRFAIFMCNLKAAKMRGILSNGMIMCASTPEKVEIIDPPPGVKQGDRVSVDGYPGKYLLNPRSPRNFHPLEVVSRVTSSGRYICLIWDRTFTISTED